MPEQTHLFLVPTPIGNLDDITLRALKVLNEVDIILAEDTRTSGKLLRHHHINRPLMSYHIFNEHQLVEKCVEKMRGGAVFALISDAGTPAISDPGFLLVRETLRQEMKVSCLPGATAFVPALVNSGLPSDRFVFEGFLPHKKGRQTRLKKLAEEERTIIIYEAPHRLIKCLEQLRTFLGDRQASVSRELTKIFEETVKGTFSELIDHFNFKGIKGEFVIVVSGFG